MQRQKAISLSRNKFWIGRELDVLIEGRAPHDPTMLVGRSFRDAPEIDGQVFVKKSLAKPGNFVRVKITDARPYDLVGVAGN